ncbi:hypothetical protein [Streptomyces sp. NPDC059256]|uniref:hypothetical protein n=1 Tax=Streptomyces sp. NPDC059256 TaxID=3346794 RepID=UPI0036CEE654
MSARPPVPAPRTNRRTRRSAAHRTVDPATDVVRWAGFSCLLVPVVLVVYGTSVGGAAAASLGLVAVTAVCRVLLRRSERIAAAAGAHPTGRDRGARGAVDRVHRTHTERPSGRVRH